MALPLAIPLILQGAQMIYGLSQQGQNDEPDQPTYHIPQEVFEAEEIMADRVRSGLPGKELMRESLDSSFASTTGAIKDVASGGALIGGTADAYGDLLRGVKDIELMESQYIDQAKLGLADAKYSTAQYQDRAYDENVRIPYERDYNEFINMRNAAATNFFGGLNSMGKTFMAHQSNEDMMAMIDKIFGGGGMGGGTGGDAVNSWSGVQDFMNMSGMTNMFYPK